MLRWILIKKRNKFDNWIHNRTFFGLILGFHDRLSALQCKLSDSIIYYIFIVYFTDQIPQFIIILFIFLNVNAMGECLYWRTIFECIHIFNQSLNAFLLLHIFLLVYNVLLNLNCILFLKLTEFGLNVISIYFVNGVQSPYLLMLVHDVINDLIIIHFIWIYET